MCETSFGNVEGHNVVFFTVAFGRDLTHPKTAWERSLSSQPSKKRYVPGTLAILEQHSFRTPTCHKKLAGRILTHHPGAFIMGPGLSCQGSDRGF